MKVLMILIVLFVLFFYGLANYYIAKKLFNFLKFCFPKINSTIYSILYVIISISFILSFTPVKSLKYIFNIVGSIWLCFFVYFLLFFLLADIVLILLKTFNLIASRVPRHIEFIVSSFVILITCTFVFYGMFNARKIENVEYNIKLESKKLENDINLVLVSDLHLGSPFSEGNLKKIVENINELNPDIVCIAGDLFDNDYDMIKNPIKVKEMLKGIKSKYGVYASLGNHDGGSTFEKLMQLSKESNIKFLNDDYINIDNKFILIGRVDPSPIGGFNELERQELNTILDKIESDLPIIVMDHNPANYKQYEDKVDLVLSGHTHKGQIFPGDLITNMLYKVDYGYLKTDSTHVIVTSGVGTWKLPLRIGSNNEIVTIKISSKS